MRLVTAALGDAVDEASAATIVGEYARAGARLVKIGFAGIDSHTRVATLLAARVFVGPGLQRTVRWFLTANGLLLPFIALQMYVHPLIWVASLWAVTFPGATWALAVLFHRATAAPSAS